MQVALDSSVNEDSDERLSSVQHEYFDRCVAVMSAAQKLTDTAIMLTRAAEPYHPGTANPFNFAF